jgi:hypothetical protein
MGRAAHAGLRRASDTGADLATLAVMIHDEIRSLLDAPPTGDDAPSLDAVEDTLTAGYARAMALEAERRRLERRIAEVAAELGHEAPQRPPSELADLSRSLSATDGKLTQLRALLSSLRSRADEIRTTA